MRRPFTVFLRLAGMVLVIFLAFASAVPVQAHAILERTDPPDNAVLSQAPSQIRMWFSENVAIQFSSVRLLDVNGQAVDGLRLALDPSDPRLVVVSLPNLGEGIYSLDWQILSGSDGHDTQGLLVFGINQVPTGSVASPPSSAPSLPQVAARALLDIGLCGLFGTLAIGLALLFMPEAETEAALLVAAARSRWRAVAWCLGMATLAILAGLAQWLVQVIPPGSGWAAIDWNNASSLLTETAWGQFWLARQVLLLGVGGLLLARRQVMAASSRRDWVAAAGLTAGALIAYAFSTHAAGLSAPLLPLLSDFLHLLSAGLWVGGLIGLVVILLPALRRTPGGREFFQATWGRFGRFAAVAVGLTLATGLFNSAGLVASPSALTESAYGQSLEFKIGLVLAAGLIGLLNSLALHPRLAVPLKRRMGLSETWRPFDRSHLPVTVALEAVLGLAVFGLAGLVASNSPANGPAYRYGGIEQPDTLTQTIDDLQVSLSVLPNLPGQNIIEIHADSTQNPAPAEILRVILRVTYLGETLGTQSTDATLVEPGLYRLGGNYLSLPGPWKMDVVVRRKGINDSISSFTWNVDSQVNAPLDLNFLLQTPLWIGAGLLLLLTLGLALRLFRPGQTINSSPSPEERPAQSPASALDELKPK